jgi:hypothetical protein
MQNRIPSNGPDGHFHLLLEIREYGIYLLGTMALTDPTARWCYGLFIASGLQFVNPRWGEQFVKPQAGRAFRRDSSR